METTTAEFAGAFASGYDSPNHRRASPALTWSKYRIVAAVKGLAERRHALLPLVFPDHREPFYVGEVFAIEFDVLPSGIGFPAVEADHVEKHSQFSVLPDESLELGHKCS
jgi:hypothetical protein